MKLFILPANEERIPRIRPWRTHSKAGFTMEIDFLNFLKKSDMLVDSPEEADWHFFPINWTFWLLNNDYGRANIDKMQAHIDEVVIDDSKTFTVSEAEHTPTKFKTGKMRIFSANQATSGETPIPLLSKPHQIPEEIPDIRYLTNFLGWINPWPIRVEMREVLKDRDDVYIEHRKTGEEDFVNMILASYTTLCPRGSAGSSYRFYETLQLGRVPIFIGEEDLRPFPKQIDWSMCSFYIDSPSKLPALLDSFDKENLVARGKYAKQVWEKLWYQGWCRMVLKCL